MTTALLHLRAGRRESRLQIRINLPNARFHAPSLLVAEGESDAAVKNRPHAQKLPVQSLAHDE
jgi:hypothetical protein